MKRLDVPLRHRRDTHFADLRQNDVVQHPPVLVHALLALLPFRVLLDIVGGQIAERRLGAPRLFLSNRISAFAVDAPGPTLDKLCAAIPPNKKEMQKNVSRDKMIFRYEDAAQRAAGIDPRAAVLYTVLPLLSDKESPFFIRQIRLFAEAKRAQQKPDQ